MTEDAEDTVRHEAFGPHWWDVFNESWEPPVVKPPRPRWPLILGALLFVGLVAILVSPIPATLNGN